MTADTLIDERVVVSLKSLVNLAKQTVGLNLGHKKIRSAQSGAYVSKFKGRGMAFDETRLYQFGDDVRRIDWRVTARTDKPHSKIFTEERERPLFISVDYSSSMQFATRGVFKSVKAANLAALLAWTAQKTGDRIGGQIFCEKGCQELKPQSGKAAVMHFFNALVQPRYIPIQTEGLESVFSRLNYHARPGSQVFIISDFRGLNIAAERHLAHLARHCDVVLVHIFDPLETELPVKGQYRFTDGLREVFIDTQDKNKSQEYHQRFLNRQQYLQQLCRKLSISWLSCQTNQSALDVLLTFQGKAFKK